MDDAALDELAQSITLERHHPADRRPQGRRSISDHRRRAPLARRARSPACSACRSSSARCAPGDERSLLEMALIENIQRENLNPIEEALAYRRLADEFELTQEAIAAAVGKDRATVANVVRLLKLPDEVRAEVASGTSVDGPRPCAARRWPMRPTSGARARRHRPEPVGPRDRIAGQEDRRGRSVRAEPLQPPRPVDVHTRAAEERLRLAPRHPRPHRPAGRAGPDRDRLRLGRRADPALRAADRGGLSTATGARTASGRLRANRSPDSQTVNGLELLSVRNKIVA